MKQKKIDFHVCVHKYTKTSYKYENKILWHLTGERMSTNGMCWGFNGCWSYWDQNSESFLVQLYCTGFSGSGSGGGDVLQMDLDFGRELLV